MYMRLKNIIFVSSVGMKRIDCVSAAGFVSSVGIKMVDCVCAAREFCLSIEGLYIES